MVINRQYYLRPWLARVMAPLLSRVRLICRHAKTTGYLYEAHLRDRLSSELGVGSGEVVNEIADVAGVPEQMIDHLSKRSREIRGRLHE